MSGFTGLRPHQVAIIESGIIGDDKIIYLKDDNTILVPATLMYKFYFSLFSLQDAVEACEDRAMRRVENSIHWRCYHISRQIDIKHAL